MKKVIMLHGICDSEEYNSDEFPSSSNSHWLPWVQKQLLINQVDCQTPDVMNSYKANYDDWKRTVSPHSIDESTTLVGHSAGCGFFLKYLSENPNIKCAILKTFEDKGHFCFGNDGNGNFPELLEVI